MEINIRGIPKGRRSRLPPVEDEWITRYFVLEAKDSYSLEHPNEAILDHGGHISLPSMAPGAIGCCALMALAPGEFEVAKMAVT